MASTEQPRVGAAEPVLKISDLSVVFERSGRRTTAIHRVNLEVGEGEFVCVVGASGCGKTTLLRAIDGLVKPTSGEIRLRGKPAKAVDGRIAMIFQNDSLMPWRTAIENVRLGLDIRGRRDKEAHRRAQACLDMVKLKGYESYYPHELSGGMRQRVNLARGFAVDPDVLLMDEPFASLDAQTREVMQTELLDVWGQDRKTVLFITHQLDEAVLLADRVIVMSAHPGQVREEIKIDIPRPRDLRTKRTPKFTAYVDHIWNLIEAEVRRSLIET